MGFKEQCLCVALACVCLPAAAQDSARGKLLYETHCGGCHYERLHERNRDRSLVKSLSDLREQVTQRAALTGRPFSLDDLSDIAAYLNRSYYRLTK
jgi:mono/diheme cytochrome c family protein